MKTHTLSLRYCLSQSEDTEKLGAKLAVLCPKSFVIFLKGPLGAGKTTFARGFIQQLGNFKRVKSPTYTLIETYTAPFGSIFHFDLYRLNDPLELEAIGIRDYTLTPAVWLIEWPERVMQEGQSAILPEPDIILCFSLFTEGHGLTITSKTKHGCELLAQLNDISETLK